MEAERLLGGKSKQAVCFPHFWKKWCVATDKGTFGAAERFYLELSEDNRRILVERAVSIYDGRGLRNRNRNIKNQTACRETLSVYIGIIGMLLLAVLPARAASEAEFRKLSKRRMGTIHFLREITRRLK